MAHIRVKSNETDRAKLVYLECAECGAKLHPIDGVVMDNDFVVYMPRLQEEKEFREYHELDKCLE